MFRLLTRPLCASSIPSSARLRLRFRTMATSSTPEFVRRCSTVSLLSVLSMPIFHRTSHCMRRSHSWTLRCRTSSTRRHGGNSRGSSSSRRRFVCRVHRWDASCSEDVLESDEYRDDGGKWLHLDEQIL